MTMWSFHLESWEARACKENVDDALLWKNIECCVRTFVAQYASFPSIKIKRHWERLFFPLCMQNTALFPQWQHPQEAVLVRMPSRRELLPRVPEYLEGPLNCEWGPQLTCHQCCNEGQSCTLEVTLRLINHAWAIPNYVVTLLPRITLLASPSFLVISLYELTPAQMETLIKRYMVSLLFDCVLLMLLTKAVKEE